MAEKRTLAQRVVELVFEPESGRTPEWEPGAHVDVHLPNDLVRQYSLCGDPNDREFLRIAVLREQDSRGGSRYIHDSAEPGDIFQISAPRNNFRLVDAERYLFIAGGIGITPLIPMLNRVRMSGADWKFVYCGRSRSAMAYIDALPDDPRVSVMADDCGPRLDLGNLLAEPRTDTAIYSCGPEGLLVAIEEASRHWPPGALHTERFKARIVDEPAREFDVLLQRSGMELHVPAEESLLDVIEHAGIPVPSSCKNGTCGTCETPVLTGEPEHRDSVLSPEEQAVGDCMMICVSRARTERLVLDL
ncbi:PDR/VanB family oxidoreductase [Nocardia vinacea]|uniref:PDR/VanB family oxidoreductase n=1 Tax=Nocardia vinacea TaxID=96468 RepID=UPI002E11C234|nr:PDR/VanB family oxidoreductase [Nocardia vinacea]